MKWLLVLVGVLSMSVVATAQVPGDPTGPAGPNDGSSQVPPDTLFVFTPVRPLIDSMALRPDYDDAYGFDILFSGSGFGLGGFYQHVFSGKLSGLVSLDITGSRTKDEFDELLPDPSSSTGYSYRIRNKVNRLYALPLTISLRYRILDQVLVDNFRPYVNAGIGPTLLVALPYDYDFFSSFGHASGYVTGGGFLGVGAEFGGKRPLLGVNIRYYYIPFHPGLESLRGDPITDFGGLFLLMNVGFSR